MFILYGCDYAATHHCTAVLGLEVPVLALPLWVRPMLRSGLLVGAVSWTGRQTEASVVWLAPMDEYTPVRIVDQKIDNPQALGMGRSVIVVLVRTPQLIMAQLC